MCVVRSPVYLARQTAMQYCVAFGPTNFIDYACQRQWIRISNLNVISNYVAIKVVLVANIDGSSNRLDVLDTVDG